MFPLLLISSFLTVSLAEGPSKRGQDKPASPNTTDYSVLTEQQVEADLAYRAKEINRLADLAMQQRTRLQQTISRWQHGLVLSRFALLAGAAVAAKVEPTAGKVAVAAIPGSLQLFLETKADIAGRKSIVDACTPVIRARETMESVHIQGWRLQKASPDFRRGYVNAMNLVWIPVANAASTAK